MKLSTPAANLPLVPNHRRRLHKPSETVEYSPYFARVFQPVSVALSISVVAHDVGQTQSAEHGAHPLHASTDRAGNLAWVQFLVLCKQLNDCERNRIAEQPAQTRLSVAVLFHAACLSCFRNSENMEVSCRCTVPDPTPGQKKRANDVAKIWRAGQ